MFPITLFLCKLKLGVEYMTNGGKKPCASPKRWRNKVFWVIHKIHLMQNSRSCCIALISKVEWIILKFWTNFSSLSQTLFWQIVSSLAACCLAATLAKHLVLIFLLWQLFGWQCTSSMETRNVFFCLVFPISKFADDDLVRLFKPPKQLFE